MILQAAGTAVEVLDPAGQPADQPQLRPPITAIIPWLSDHFAGEAQGLTWIEAERDQLPHYVGPESRRTASFVLHSLEFSMRYWVSNAYKAGAKQNDQEAIQS